MLKFEDYLEQRIQDEILRYMVQNGHENANTASPVFRALNDTYKQAYLSYNYGDNIAEKLRNNNTTLYNGKFTRDTVNELLANEWNSKAGIETAKMVKTNPISGLNPNEQMLNTIGEHLANNKLITSPNNARKLDEFDSVFKPVNETPQQVNNPVFKANIDKNMILTPPENPISKPALEEYPEDYKPADKLFKIGVEKNISDYDLIQENKNLSTEEKVDKIHEVAEKRNQEIEKEHRKGMNKVYGKAVWDVSSNFIPAVGPFAKVATGIGKILSPLSKKAAPFVGKKIAENSTKEFARGIATSPIVGTGDAITEDKKVLPSIFDKMVPDYKSVLTQYILPNWINKTIAKSKLNTKNPVNELPLRQQRKLQDKTTQYYEDYLEGTSARTKNGEFVKFDKLKDKISPEKASSIPDLPKQIKTGKIKSQNDLDSLLGIPAKNSIPEDWLKKLLRSHRSHI